MKHNDTRLHMTRAVLTPAEKMILRRGLCDHMRAPSAAHAFAYGHFWRVMRLAAVGFTTMVLAGAGISYAAENALPGDALYVMKVEVNERVWTWTALSQEAKAEWSVTRTMRRLEELERLAMAGELSDTLRDEITVRLDENTEDANEAITSLKEEHITVAADASSRLESSLRVHERMLVQVAEERADISSQIHVILDTVRKKTESVSEVRQEIEKELTDTKQSVATDMILEDPHATSTPILEEQQEEKNTEEPHDEM